MEEPGRQQSMGSLRVGHDWATSLSCIGEGNGNPLQCSCLENPRDGGAWWATIYGVAQSQTRLKWLSKPSLESLSGVEPCTFLSMVHWSFVRCILFPQETILEPHNWTCSLSPCLFPSHPVVLLNIRRATLSPHRWLRKIDSVQMQFIWNSERYWPSRFLPICIL